MVAFLHIQSDIVTEIKSSRFHRFHVLRWNTWLIGKWSDLHTKSPSTVCLDLESAQNIILAN